VTASTEARGYANPVVAGVCLGLLLFASVLVAGRGLSASGAFASGAAAVVNAAAPKTAAAHSYIASWIPRGQGGLFGDWVVLELLGVAAGAWLSARLAGRLYRGVERIAGESSRSRLLQALAGGSLMGAGARLAHGCTSGLALTGGALLATGAWLFIPLAFATAFFVAWVRGRFSVVA
jgi:hypothetical protein